LLNALEAIHDLMGTHANVQGDPLVVDF